jgi:hypothetical protein
VIASHLVAKGYVVHFSGEWGSGSQAGREAACQPCGRQRSQLSLTAGAQELLVGMHRCHNPCLAATNKQSAHLSGPPLSIACCPPDSDIIYTAKPVWQSYSRLLADDGFITEGALPFFDSEWMALGRVGWEAPNNRGCTVACLSGGQRPGLVPHRLLPVSSLPACPPACLPTRPACLPSCCLPACSHGRQLCDAAHTKRH